MSATVGDTQRIRELIDTYILYAAAARYGRSDISTKAYAELQTYPTALILDVAEQMLGDSDPETRFTGARMLLATDVQHYLPRVVYLLTDEDPDLRCSVALIVGAYHDVRAVPALIAMLETESDVDARVQAAESLGELGDPRALPALRHAAQHDTGIGWNNHGVAETAQDAIHRIEMRTMHGERDDS